jgi:hypothetical protein
MAVLEHEDRAAILFAAQVLDAYGIGHTPPRVSQAAKDLRELVARSTVRGDTPYGYLLDHVQDHVTVDDELE